MASFTSTSTDNITNAIGHIDRAIGIVDGEIAKNNAIVNTPLSSASTSASTGPQTIVAVANATPIKINVLLLFDNANDNTNKKCRIVNEKPTQRITTRDNEKWVFLELEYNRNTSKIVTTDFKDQTTIPSILTTIGSFTIKITDINGIIKCVESAIDTNNTFFIIENNYLKINPVYVEKDSTIFKLGNNTSDVSKTFEITPDVQIGSSSIMGGSSDPKLKLSFDDEVKFQNGEQVKYANDTEFTATPNDVKSLNTMLEKITITSTKGGAKSKTKKGGRGRRRYKTKRR
jgi:hypothetical protein